MAIEELRYIAIEGVIGAGKTSLTARLSQTLGAKAIYEEFEKIESNLFSENLT